MSPSMTIPKFLMRDRVAIEDRVGATGRGTKYKGKRYVKAARQDRIRFIRSPDGQETQSEVTLRMPVEDAPVAGSRITLDDGRMMQVASVLRMEGVAGGYAEVVLS